MPTIRKRKYPFPTAFAFTKSRLLEEAERVKALGALGLDQVEFSCTAHRGMRAVIYASGRIKLYTRYSYRKRPYRIPLGELGLLTLEQARVLHQRYRLQASQGEDPKAPKVSNLIYRELHEAHYVVQCRARQKKTLHTDLSRHANWLGPEFDDMPAAAITKTHVSRFILKMQEAGLAPATIRTIIGQLKTTLDIGVELGAAPRNVAKGVRLPRVDNRRTEFLEVPQVAAFMTAAQASTQVVGSRMLMLMALTGARLGEARALQWCHLDLEAGTWFLPTQKSGRPGVIHLSEPAKAVIRELLPYRRNDFASPGERDNEQLARPIRLFKKLCQQAGISEGYRIHDLRHAWCSAGVYAGIPLEVLSQGARHSSPVVTRIYAHAHTESLVAAQATIGALFMPAQS